MPEASHNTALPAAPLQTRLILAGAALLPALALAAAMSSETLLLLALAGVCGVALLPSASWAGIVFFALALGLRTPMNFMPLRVGGFRLYGGDALLYIVGAALLYTLFTAARGRRAPLVETDRNERIILLLLLLLTGWGVLSSATGVMRGQELRDIIGDFRRFYVYSWALLPPLCFMMARRHITGTKLALLAGCGGAFLFGAYRTLSGNHFYPNDEIDIFPRLLADDEIVSLALLLAYLTAFLMAKRPRALKAAALAMAAATAAMMCFSGWRMGIAQALLAPMLVVVLMARNRGKGVGGIVLRVGAVMLLLALGVGLVFAAMSGHVDRVMKMLDERMYSFGIPLLSDEDTRYYAYREALARYAAHPVLGSGLGDQLSYPKKTSSGTFLYMQGTTHNLFLDTLYQTGPVGLGLFLALHGFFSWHFWRRIKKIDPRHEPVAVGLFAGYLCTLAHYCYEPAWVSGMIVLYFSMGFLLVFLRHVRPEAETPAPEAAPA